MTDVNPEPCTVDEYVDRSVGRWPTKLIVAELLQTAAQRRVIWDREIDVEQVCQATEEALGLAERKVEDHVDRER